MEPKDTIEELKQLALAFRDARNWGQFHDLKSLAMGLSIEAAELLELFLWKDKKDAGDFVASETGRRRLEEEMADVLVYLLYLSERHRGANDLTLDISKAQLASILGTIPETLSRILARMTGEGIIASDEKRHIRIRDRKTVELLAQGEKRLG